jgi:anti-sigma factor RsiW
MSCQEARELIHGYVDGELDLVRNLEMERHFHECGVCARMREKMHVMRSAISGSLPYFEAPRDLRSRVRSQLRAASPLERPSRRLGPQWQWAGIAAAVILAATGAWRVARVQQNSGGAEILAQEVVSSHVRSLMAAHLTDVPSSDRHTVKPWFNGKLNFSPVVGDFVDRGFALIGGRLDYLDQRPVAALVYQRRKHVINLFVWPAPVQADSSVETFSRQGYHVLHWTRDHMAYWAVSDLNAAELAELAGLVRQAE